MKIAIEAQRIFRHARHGMDLVAFELVRRLPLIAPQHQYRVFARSGPNASALQPGPSLQVQLVQGVSYAGWEQFSLPRAVKGSGCDLLHCTANTAPLRRSVPLLITLHDVIFMEGSNAGGSPYQRAGNAYRRWIVPRAVKRADAVITVSAYEKQVIVETLGVKEEKIHVIHHGVDERFRNAIDDATVQQFLGSLKLPSRYLLFLGNTAEKKNTEGVIKAYIHYCEHTPDALPLVIADLSGPVFDRLLEGLNKTYLRKKIFLAGYIQPLQMPLLYRGAAVFLYPSLRESFGLPVLEAMASGVPVITSLTSALPETAGNAALLVKPEDPLAISAAITELLDDRELRAACIAKGKARSLLFDWDKAATALVKVYEQFG